MSYEKLRERALARIAAKRKLAETESEPQTLAKPAPQRADEVVEFKDVGSAMAWLRSQMPKSY